MKGQRGWEGGTAAAQRTRLPAPLSLHLPAAPLPAWLYAHTRGREGTLEHLSTYVLAPMVGGLMASIFFRISGPAPPFFPSLP